MHGAGQQCEIGAVSELDTHFDSNASSANEDGEGGENVWRGKQGSEAAC